MFSNFIFENRALYEKMWDKKKYCKAWYAKDDNMVQCMLDN
jgi:hypothetical protein